MSDKDFRKIIMEIMSGTKQMPELRRKYYFQMPDFVKVSYGNLLKPMELMLH